MDRRTLLGLGAGVAAAGLAACADGTAGVRPTSTDTSLSDTPATPSASTATPAPTVQSATPSPATTTVSAGVLSPRAHLAFVAGTESGQAYGSFLFDGSDQTHWQATRSVDTVIVDTGHVDTHIGLRLGVGSTGQPRSLQVSLSVDGTTWTQPEPVATRATTGQLTHTHRQPSRARFVRLAINGVHRGAAARLTGLDVLVTPSAHPTSASLDATGLGVIGDSLTEQYPDAHDVILGHFVRAGWDADSVRINGKSGRPINAGGSPSTNSVVSQWRSEGFDPLTWLIALGTNNSLNSVAANTAEYLDVLAAIGPGRRVYFVDTGFWRIESCTYAIDLRRPPGQRYAMVGRASSANVAMYNLRDRQLDGQLDDRRFAQIVAVGNWNTSPLITPRRADEWMPAAGSLNNDGSWLHNTIAGYDKRDQMYAALVADAL